MKQFFTCFLVLFCCLSRVGFGQKFPVDTLRKTGPLNNRINVVILGDGFTQSEMPAFTQAARKFIDFFLGYSPYNSYRNYFNFFSIQVPSNQSGATNPGTAPDRYPNQPVEKKDTYFGASFGTNNIHRLVAIRNYQAYTNVMALNFPTYDLAVMIVNSTWYGGSGGDPATFTLNELANLIAMHEIGHIFSSLTDEYWAGTVYAHEAVNMTRVNDPARVVWKNWLNQFNVGIYPHSGASDAGNWYKPTTHNCLMEQLDKSFCAVCREATTNKILTVVKPVERVLPSVGPLVPVSDQPVTFQLGLVKPEPNTLRVEWRLNNKLILQNSDQLILSASQLTDPSSTLVASVIDTTQFIKLENHRIDHTYSYRWTLTKEQVFKPFSVSASQSAICAGESVVLTALNCTGTVTWSTNTTASSLTVSPAQSSSYSAVCSLNGAPSDSATVSIQVVPLPAATATNTGPYVEGQAIQLSAQGGKNYTWKGPNNFQSSEQNPILQSAKISQAGSYTVMVTNENGCSSTAQTQVIINPLLVISNLPADAIQVFPNPSKGRVQVQTSLDGPFEISLLDAAGHIVVKKAFVRETELITDKFQKTIYFYRISNQSGFISGKLIVE